ncbi:MAG: hypothetical protein K8R59_08625 [Thermoanaerobaculales bacterium]|nr:hypothetical protein [Thermoanaerobaculales bacterium]
MRTDPPLRSRLLIPLLLWFATACVLTSLMGCGRCPARQVPDTVRMAYTHTLVTLDPHAHNDGVTGAVLASVYQALVEVEPGAIIRPMLAQQWTTPDDLSWRFELRPGVHFHNGAEVTVDDVVSSIRRARFDSGSGLADLLTSIKEIGALPENPLQAFEITTEAPFPLLLSRLAMVAIVPQAFDPSQPIGTGPYRWVSGSQRGPVVLERWDGFWAEKPTIRKVTIDFVATDEELIEMMFRDELDVVAKAGLDYLLQFDLEDVPGVWHVVSNPAAATTMVGLNIQAYPLNDIRVRTALDLALDRRMLIQLGLPEGSAVPALSLVPEEVFGASPRAGNHMPDLAKARELMAEADVPKGTVIHLQHARVSPPLVAMVADTFRSLDMTVEVEDIPYEVYYRRIGDGSIEAYIFGWNFLFGDASEFLESMVHSRDPGRRLGILNGTGYSDPLLDRWIDSARHEVVPERRLGYLRSALESVEEARIYLPIYHSARQALFREPYTMIRRPGSWLRPFEVVVE